MKKLKLILVALLAVTMCQAQEDISLEDYKFTTTAAKAGLMELKLSQLALINGSSAEIRMLGEQMVARHTKINKELKKLADKRGIYLLADLDEKQQKQFRKLAEKTGAEFDKAYAKCMVRDHKDVIEKFEKEIKKGQDPELINWASATLQVLESQVQLSKETNDFVNEEKSYTYNKF